MPADVRKPYWVDDACPKHEAYRYGESEARRQALKVGDQTLDLLVPQYLPDFEVKLARLSDGFLFIIGEEILDEDQEEYGEEICGIAIVAKRCAEDVSTYWTLIAHTIYPETLDFLDDAKPAIV